VRFISFLDCLELSRISFLDMEDEFTISAPALLTTCTRESIVGKKIADVFVSIKINVPGRGSSSVLRIAFCA
jgi:hypothetical protein